MKLLAIDTTEESCSAALYQDGVTEERFELAPRRHSQLILPMMEDLLASAGIVATQLDGLAFGRGPGSFTGLRIAAGVIQGVALAADLPVIPVSSLQGLAQGAYREYAAGKVMTALDARMGEVYWCLYTVDAGGLMQPAEEEKVVAPSAVLQPDTGNWVGAGSGWAAYEATLRARAQAQLESIFPRQFCHAQDIAVLGVTGIEAGKGLPAEQALPVYLRDKVAEKMRK